MHSMIIMCALKKQVVFNRIRRAIFRAVENLSVTLRMENKKHFNGKKMEKKKKDGLTWL